MKTDVVNELSWQLYKKKKSIRDSTYIFTYEKRVLSLPYMGLTWGNIKKESFQCTDSKYYQQKESKIEFAWESKKRSNSLKMEQHTFIFIIHYYREYRKTTLEHCCIYHSKEQSTVGKFTWFFYLPAKKLILVTGCIKKTGRTSREGTLNWNAV